MEIEVAPLQRAYGENGENLSCKKFTRLIELDYEIRQLEYQRERLIRNKIMMMRMLHCVIVPEILDELVIPEISNIVNGYHKYEE
jgi:hypothetical protein